MYDKLLKIARVTSIIEKLEGQSDSPEVQNSCNELRSVLSGLFLSLPGVSAEETEEVIPTDEELRKLLQTEHGLGATYNQLSRAGRNKLMLAVYHQVMLFDLDKKVIEPIFADARKALRLAVLVSKVGFDLTQEPINQHSLAELGKWLRFEFSLLKREEEQ